MNVPHHLRSSLIKWISKRLRDECGDSSDAVSKNIMNVLRNDTKDKVKMKTMIASQLEEYSSNADSFAEDLFKTIESRSFVEMEDESVDSDDSDRDDRRGVWLYSLLFRIGGSFLSLSSDRGLLLFGLNGGKSFLLSRVCSFSSQNFLFLNSAYFSIV